MAATGRVWVTRACVVSAVLTLVVVSLSEGDTTWLNAIARGSDHDGSPLERLLRTRKRSHHTKVSSEDELYIPRYDEDDIGDEFSGGALDDEDDTEVDDSAGTIESHAATNTTKTHAKSKKRHKRRHHSRAHSKKSQDASSALVQSAPLSARVSSVSDQIGIFWTILFLFVGICSVTVLAIALAILNVFVTMTQDVEGKAKPEDEEQDDGAGVDDDNDDDERDRRGRGDGTDDESALSDDDNRSSASRDYSTDASTDNSSRSGSGRKKKKKKKSKKKKSHKSHKHKSGRKGDDFKDSASRASSMGRSRASSMGSRKGSKKSVVIQDTPSMPNPVHNPGYQAPTQSILSPRNYMPPEQLTSLTPAEKKKRQKQLAKEEKNRKKEQKKLEKKQKKGGKPSALWGGEMSPRGDAPSSGFGVGSESGRASSQGLSLKSGARTASEYDARSDARSAKSLDILSDDMESNYSLNVDKVQRAKGKYGSDTYDIGIMPSSPRSANIDLGIEAGLGKGTEYLDPSEKKSQKRFGWQAKWAERKQANKERNNQKYRKKKGIQKVSYSVRQAMSEYSESRSRGSSLELALDKYRAKVPKVRPRFAEETVYTTKSRRTRAKLRIRSWATLAEEMATYVYLRTGDEIYGMYWFIRDLYDVQSQLTIQTLIFVSRFTFMVSQIANAVAILQLSYIHPELLGLFIVFPILKHVSSWACLVVAAPASSPGLSTQLTLMGWIFPLILDVYIFAKYVYSNIPTHLSNPILVYYERTRSIVHVLMETLPLLIIQCIVIGSVPVGDDRINAILKLTILVGVANVVCLVFSTVIHGVADGCEFWDYLYLRFHRGKYESKELRTAAMIAEGLAEDFTVEELYLSDLNLQDEGTRMIAKALKINNTLQRLDLSENSIGDFGWQNISQVFRVNTSLISIDLSFNQVSDKAMEHLASGLERNDSLRHISFEGCQITDVGVARLGKCIERNQSIEFIVLLQNSISDKGVVAFKKSLDLNDSIQCLLLNDNFISGEVVRKLFRSDPRVEILIF
eukprot:GFYU01003491.1.p1 GENE.GFYU01003491.1~~GFYU01003491.1.p1  ORF type:complete len:1026 (+),score=210.26 GFYU01003491.1:351-3428(+)